MGVVPGGVGLEGAGQLVVDGGAVAPIHRAEGLLEPDVGPVAVARDALQVQLDTGLGQRLLEHLAAVGSARESAFGHLQLHRAGDVGLFEVELGLVGVVGVQLLLGVVVLHLRAHGVVVADGGVAREHVVHDLLAVNAKLQRQHQVGVAERRLVGVGYKGKAVTGTWRARQLDVLALGQQPGGFGVYAVDHVHLAGHQRLGAGSGIADVAQFHAVEVATVGFPVVAGLAFEGGAHTGLELFQQVGTGAVGLAEIGGAVGHHDDVVIAQVIWQIQIAIGHENLNLGGRYFLDLADIGQQGFGGRFGFAPVHIDRVNDIVGIQCFAGSKGNAFADIEDPVGGTGLDLPAFKQLTGSVAVVGHLHQVVPQHQADVDHHRVGIGAGVEAVRRRAAFHAHAQGSALFWCALGHGGHGTESG